MSEIPEQFTLDSLKDLTPTELDEIDRLRHFVRCWLDMPLTDLDEVDLPGLLLIVSVSLQGSRISAEIQDRLGQDEKRFQEYCEYFRFLDTKFSKSDFVKQVSQAGELFTLARFRACLSECILKGRLLPELVEFGYWLEMLKTVLFADVIPSGFTRFHYSHCQTSSSKISRDAGSGKLIREGNGYYLCRQSKIVEYPPKRGHEDKYTEG